MLENLKNKSRQNINFLKERWDSPIHSKYASDQQGLIWPSSDEFYHPLNPMYSCFLKKPADLEYFKVILLKDGAYMLLDFFFKFPTPKPNYPQILIPADLSFLVPKTWHSHVLCYRLNCDFSQKMTNKIVFLSLASESFMAWPIFKTDMAKWLEQFPREAEVSMFYAIRADAVDPDYSEKKLPFEFLHTISRYFKNEITLLNFNELKMKFANPENSFVNFNLYRTANSLCSMEILASSQRCPVYQRPQYKGFSGKHVGSWPITFNAHLDLFTHGAQEADFEELFFWKKLITPTGAALPYPLVPKLLAVMEKRFNIF